MSNTPRSCADPFAKPLRRTLHALLAGLLALPLAATALPEDASEPVEISADLTQFDNKRQTHTLKGNVEIRQGSMLIRASQITIELKNGEIARLEGQGDPLHYSATDNDGQALIATAQKIIYKPAEAALSLLGDAKLSRPDRTLSGERIDYNMRNERVNASGNDKKRVKIVIQPEQKKP